MTTHYRVNRVFDTIQGEGALAGRPSTFIRLQGCPVGCSWCDTKYTWAAGGVSMSTPEILDLVNQPHVVITGGEPTLWDLEPLTHAILSKNPGTTLQLETSGAKVLKSVFPGFVTWSPKPNLNWDAPEALKCFVNEIKFVVDDRLQIETIHRVLKYFEGWSDLPIVTLMPEGSPPSEANIDRVFRLLWTKVVNFGPFATNIRYGDRLQYRLGID